jgi:asparagine synthase (glutamine-hydrolysing)
MMHLDLKQTLADNDLRKVNGMCEFAGMRVGYPLLNERLVEFSARLAPDLKVRRGQLRYFFKEALSDFLPTEIIQKRKHGFGLPFGIWLATHPPLQDLATRSLRRLQDRGYIRPSYIEWLLAQHRESHASYYGVMVWVLVMLEEWLTAHGL